MLELVQQNWPVAFLVLAVVATRLGHGRGHGHKSSSGGCHGGQHTEPGSRPEAVGHERPVH